MNLSDHPKWFFRTIPYLDIGNLACHAVKLPFVANTKRNASPRARTASLDAGTLGRLPCRRELYRRM